MKSDFMQRYKDYIEGYSYNFEYNEKQLLKQQINIDLAQSKERRDFLKIELKKFPFGHPTAINIRAEIESLENYIKRLSKKKVF